jgi:predicted lysophospholipase L1 biosynthesis ABC-type transport system permease subunit
VAIVNQALVAKFFPGKNPIGKRYRPAEGSKSGDFIEIIGVAENAKSMSLREEMQPTVYLAASQDAKTGDSSTFELRASAGTPASLISSVRSSILDVNRDVSLQFKTLAVQLDESLAPERLLAALSGFFGGLALLLATIGLYGVMSYSVTRRRNEIGIRMALGAEQSRVLRTLLAEAAMLIAIGLSAAIGTTRFIASFLYGLKPNDPWTLFLASALLALVALLAGFLPARRAARLDPMNALREE